MFSLTVDSCQWTVKESLRDKQNDKLVFENNAVIARPVRTLVVAIPRPHGTR